MSFDLVHYLYRKFPYLRDNLVRAHMRISPLNFIKKMFMNSLMLTLTLSIFSMFMIDKYFSSNGIGVPKIVTPFISLFIIFPLLFFMFFPFLLNTPLSVIKKRKKDIDKDTLFAARYLLIKLNSGQPLLNALIDASRSYGVASKYFKEIVDNVNLGMPLEESIERAMMLSPSPNFQKILFQVNNALRIGVDVTVSLRGVIKDIADEQMSQIEAYNHKLNSFAMFYMLIAIVAPSLGLTIFILIAGLIGMQISTAFYFVLWLVIVITQLLFINLFKAIRPNINF